MWAVDDVVGIRQARSSSQFIFIFTRGSVYLKKLFPTHHLLQQPLFSGVSRSFNTSMVPVEALLPTLFTNVTSVDSMEQEINLKSKFNAIVKSNCSRLRTTFLFTTDQISSM